MDTDDSETVSPSMAIVERVAALEGLSPTDLPEQLYHVVDPEALDRLVDSADDDTEIRFTYCGHDVLLTGAGALFVNE